MRADKIQTIAILIGLFGLVLTGIGAFVAARAVIISERQANDLASTKWDMNVALPGTSCGIA